MIEFSTVFGSSGNGTVDKLSIANLVVSKSQNSVRLELVNELSDVIKKLATEHIRSKLGNVAVELVTDTKYLKEKNVCVYNFNPNPDYEESILETPSVIGKVVCADIMLLGKKIKDSDVVSIASITENSGRVTVSGRVFDADEREIKTKTGKEMHIVTFDITDGYSAITVKAFVDKGENDEKFNTLFPPIKKSLKKGGLYVVCRGTVKYDDYAKEAVLFANDIAEIESPPVRKDNAEVKRVELHMHTLMSQMDAVSSAEDLIERAIYWGHKAIALTDHGVVQAYPNAMHASDNNEKIKVFYGVEGYLVDDSKKIVYDITDETVDSPFVVFDIETTGLDKNKCKIIEIGAVKILNGEIIDRWSSFVNPNTSIPKKITELTSITDSMVRDA